LDADRLNTYLYTDTKQLVALVEDAAAMVEREGSKAFAEFGRKDSKWFTDDRYIFVYSAEGTCLFHPISPELVGKNLIGFKDMHGRPVIRLISEIGRRPERDASGWVFYLWEEGTQFTPLWKSSYIRKAVGPDGKIYIVGSGSYNIKIEKVFIQTTVNRAAELLKTKGKEAAFAEIRDSSSPLHILGTYVFVIDEKGYSLVDPAFPTHVGRNLHNFKGAEGRHVITEVLRKLEQADDAWVQYLWPKPGSALPSRKLLYVRKVKVDNETLYVGSDFFMAPPIWMRQ
jgi:signal transduction histidine kinase